MTLRIRCEVLKALSTIGPTDSLTIQKNLPHLQSEQVQKAIYRLLDQDRIEKVGKVKRDGKNGRPLFVYQARDDWEPSLKKKNTVKKGRKNYEESLRSNASVNAMPTFVAFRDRKIRLLQKLVKRSGGTDKDLLIGILADYGAKEI